MYCPMLHLDSLLGTGAQPKGPGYLFIAKELSIGGHPPH
jgi:hypothetical protein